MITDWLSDFLFSISASFPPADWPEVDTKAYDVFFEDFRKAFARHGVSEAEADAARSLLAEDPPRFKVDYLPRVLRAVAALRQAGKAAGLPRDVLTPRPDQATIDASRGCPECTRERGPTKSVGPTGWARRRTFWHSHPAPMTVELFCRCPLGRWRSVNDIELVRNEKVRQHDDLQARPELWDFELQHPSWSWQSTTHDLVMPEGTDGLWRYLKVDEPAPPPIRPRDIAARIAGSMGKVEPAVPLPPKWEATIDGQPIPPPETGPGPEARPS